MTKTTKREKKYQELLQHFQCVDPRASDAHRAHTTLMDTSKIKGYVEGNSHGSRITQYDPKKSNVATRVYLSYKKVQMCTEKSSDTQKKDGVNLEGSREYHLPSDQLGAQTQISLHRGRSRLLSHKRPKKNPVADQ